jgi:hypothetical protein
MKRINPKTGLPFKRGDVREDGFIFLSYISTTTKNKLWSERWFSPEDFKKEVQQLKSCGEKDHKNRRINTLSRAKMLLREAKRRANKSGSICSIDVEWVKTRLDSGLCELTEIPFQLESVPEYTTNPYGPSIDRRDPKNRNYTPDNCRLILSFANRALNECTQEQALPILEAMVKAIK